MTRRDLFKGFFAAAIAPAVARVLPNPRSHFICGNAQAAMQRASCEDEHSYLDIKAMNAALKQLYTPERIARLLPPPEVHAAIMDVLR